MSNGDKIAEGVMDFTLRLESVPLDMEARVATMLGELADSLRAGPLPSSRTRVSVSDTLGGIERY